MDPFSIVCGVVALVGQVIKTVDKIQTMVASYKSASKELTQLADNLGTFGSICQSINSALERSLASPNPAHRSGLPQEITRILSRCETTLIEIEQNLSNFRYESGAARQLRFARRKDDMIQASREIDKTCSMLQLALCADVWSFVVTQPRLSAGAVESADQVENESEIEPAPTTVGDIDTDPGSILGFEKSKYAVPARISNQTIRYRSLAGQVHVTRQTRRQKWSGSDEDITGERTQYRVMLPFIPFQIEFRHQTLPYSSLGYSLDLKHIIPYKSPLQKEVDALFGMRDQDAIKQLQGLFSSRKLSVYSTVKAGGRYLSLLQIAIITRRPLLSAFLSQLDPTRKCLEEASRNDVYILYRDSDLSCKRLNKQHDQVLSVFFDSKLGGLDNDAFSFISAVFPQAEQFEIIFNHFLRLNGEDLAEWIDLAWSIAVHGYMSLILWSLRVRSGGRVVDLSAEYVDDFDHKPASEAWSPIFKRLIRLGADVHYQFRSRWGITYSEPVSAYVHALTKSMWTESGGINICAWLSLLKDCGVHLPAYLVRERRHVAEHWHEIERLQRQCLYPRSFLGLETFHFEGLPALMRRDVFDPSSSALEVLEEFRSICLHIPRYHSPPENMFALDERGIRPVEQILAQYHETQWPIRHSFQNLVELEYLGRPGFSFKGRWTPEYMQGFRQLTENNQRRVERRWNKRTKGNLTEARARMPGGWVEAD